MAILVDQYSKSMANSGLFKEFSVEKFNQVRFINESCAVNVEAVVPHLAPLLKKYGLCDLIGISRTHQHFQLKCNEIVETSIVPASTCSIPVPVDNPETLVIYLKTINLNEYKNKNKPIPYMWAYDKYSEKFFVLQFFNEDNQQMIQRLAELGQRMEQLCGFINEFVQGLKQYHMEDDLGIFIRYQDLVPVDGDKDVLMEDTDMEQRVQIIYPRAVKSLDEEKAAKPDVRLVLTQWTFDETVDGVMTCKSECVNCHNHR